MQNQGPGMERMVVVPQITIVITGQEPTATYCTVATWRGRTATGSCSRSTPCSTRTVPRCSHTCHDWNNPPGTGYLRHPGFGVSSTERKGGERQGDITAVGFGASTYSHFKSSQWCPTGRSPTEI